MLGQSFYYPSDEKNDEDFIGRNLEGRESYVLAEVRT